MNQSKNSKNFKARQKNIGRKEEPQSPPQPSPKLPRKPDLMVPFELGEAILQYLGTKPYAEVHQYIAGLMRCAQTAMVPKE